MSGFCRAEGRGMIRATTRTLLPIVVLLLACTDEDPTGLESTEFEPQAYYIPNTALSCGSNCLPDDIEGAWWVATNPPSGETLSLELDPNPPPTTQGGKVQIREWCRTRKSDGYGYPCTAPAYYTQSAAAWPSRTVNIWAKEPSNITRATFTSTAPWPTVDVLHYERPSNPSCYVSYSTTYCEGTYRLRLRLNNAGWYSTDRFYLTVLKPNGSRVSIGDASPVVTGEVLEWTWNTVGHADVGSSLVITYHPWDGKAEGKIEMLLPLRGDNPTLTLSAVEAPTFAVPEGMSLVQVQSGANVLFTPESVGGAFVEVESWEWTPADTSQAVSTMACAPAVTPCETRVFEEGTMKVTALVNGLRREATTVVGTFYPKLRLEASPIVAAVGDPVTFTATAPGATYLDVTQWWWEGDDPSSNTLPCGPGEEGCTTTFEGSGTMFCEASVDGRTERASVEVRGLCNSTGDSIFDDVAMRLRMREILIESGADETPTSRKELAGYVYRLTDGSFEIRLNTAGNQNATPCRNYPGAPDALQPGETVVGVFHTHPFHVGDLLPISCGYGSVPARAGAGGSGPDWAVIQTPYLGNPEGARYLHHYIIDGDFVYRLDPGTPRHIWEQNPKQWRWNDPNCPWI